MKYKELLKNKEILEQEVPKEVLEFLKVKKKGFEIGEDYWYIDICGNIGSYKWENDKIDRYPLLTINAFHTKEEAEFEKEKQIVEGELRLFAEENNTEEIDWNNFNKLKYYIVFDYYENDLKIIFACNGKLKEDIYFTSEELVRQAIEKVGEARIKKYLFGVDE